MCCRLSLKGKESRTAGSRVRAPSVALLGWRWGGSRSSFYAYVRASGLSVKVLYSLYKHSHASQFLWHHSRITWWYLSLRLHGDWHEG